VEAGFSLTSLAAGGFARRCCHVQVEGLYQDGGFNYGGTFVRVWHGKVEDLNTTFLEPENGHFWRQCIYGRGDDHVRWGLLDDVAVRNSAQSME
jgi:hypothetical protein